MIDWKPLLAGRTDGFGIAVGGARVGDSVDAVPFNQVTSLEPSTPSVRRSYGSKGVFDVANDGQETLVPREKLIAELRQHGGRAYVERVTYEITDKRIRKIWVRGAPLAGLSFAAEKDIERVFGPSLGVERKLGWCIYHFPDRGLSVAWDSKERQIEHVALGPVEWAPPTFGAEDVLAEWLAAIHSGLGPKWNEPKDRNTSQWVRYARVTALLRAFNLGTAQDFADGKFLEGRSLTEYPQAKKALETHWRSLGRDVGSYRDALSRLFWWLLIYRTEAERLLRRNSGWLEAGHPGILTALQVTGRANNAVAAAVSDVDALLVEMISPQRKRISEREMVTRWHWPEIDLDELLRDEF